MIDISGYFEKEIVKEGVELKTSEENPSAPAPGDMVDLEVSAIL